MIAFIFGLGFINSVFATLVLLSELQCFMWRLSISMIILIALLAVAYFRNTYVDNPYHIVITFEVFYALFCWVFYRQFHSLRQGGVELFKAIHCAWLTKYMRLDEGKE